MDYFGEESPQNMPEHMFYGALYVDYDTAIRGRPELQNFSVCPRHWYIDAVYKCLDCKKKFTWEAEEQRQWFEEWKFWIDSEPNHCPRCRVKHRHLKALREEYDELVGSARNKGSIEDKKRICAIIEELQQHFRSLPDKMLETLAVFKKQIDRNNTE